MLDLRSMSDEEFSVLVTPSVPQAAMYVRVEESGKILLSSKVEKLQRRLFTFVLTRITLQSKFQKRICKKKVSCSRRTEGKLFRTQQRYSRGTTFHSRQYFRAISARNLTNGEVNGSKTLLQSPRQLPGVQERNRTASI